MEIMCYLELKASEIMDCSDYEYAHVLYTQFLGSAKIIVECQLFKDHSEFEKINKLFDQVTEYLRSELSFIAAYNMRVTID